MRAPDYPSGKCFQIGNRDRKSFRRCDRICQIFCNTTSVRIWVRRFIAPPWRIADSKEHRKNGAHATVCSGDERSGAIWGSPMLSAARRNTRRTPRKKLGTDAWIRSEGAFSMRQCRIADVSDGGVRLIVDDPKGVAPMFVLLSTRQAAQGRRCRVKWRNGTQIGAEFLAG
jgi:hypothetical protein